MRIGVLASGRGSNLEALLAAQAAGRLSARVVAVLSDRPDAPALDRARTHGVDAVTIDPQSSRARLAPEVEARFRDELHRREVEWVILAGFFRIVGAPLLDAFPDRIVNIHPSLLPAFPGLHAQRQALEYGTKVAGCTVHLVNAEIDRGAILAQAAVAVEDADDEASLSARILAVEHHLLVETVDRIATTGFRVEGRRVLWNHEGSRT